MKSITLVLGCLLLFGCYTSKGYKKRNLTYYFSDNNPPSLCERKRAYTLRLPKGYKLENSQTEHFKGVTCHKNDSLKFYFYNTIWYYPRHNEHNQVYSGIDPRIDISVDSTSTSGTQKDSLFWRQRMIFNQNLVIGYINVSEKEKAKFDTAIESLTLVKTKKCK